MYSFFIGGMSKPSLSASSHEQNNDQNDDNEINRTQADILCREFGKNRVEGQKEVYTLGWKVYT